ncbi:putative cysteine desulfurase IscS [Dirofilaria immitis]
MNSSVPTVVSFRIPAIMIDILLGIEDEQALLIAYETETELTLHFQSSFIADLNVEMVLNIFYVMDPFMKRGFISVFIIS